VPGAETGVLPPRRRETLLATAAREFAGAGYQRASLNRIIRSCRMSKSSFYHYFDSKEALLDAVVERIAEQGAARVEPILDDPRLSATQKLDSLFAGIAEFKAERKDLLLEVMRIWLSDDNVVVREKLKRYAGRYQLPWLQRIVGQGIAEGAFTSQYPDQLARVLVALIGGMGDVAIELWIGRQEGTVTLEEVKRTFDAYREAFERMVGVRPGSLQFLDEPTVELWFG
jgi:AcrR family transcriptional regulator